MAMRTDFHPDTGAIVEDWEATLLSLSRLLRTRFGTRVMHRHLGSDVPDIQDANASGRTLFELYVSIAEAIDDPQEGEPIFDRRTIALAAGGRDGRFVFILDGDEYPLGHLGDFSVVNPRRAAIPVTGGARINLVEVPA